MKKIAIAIIAGLLLPIGHAQAQTTTTAAAGSTAVALAPPDYSDPAVVQANFEGMASAMTRISNKADQKVSVGHSGYYTTQALGRAASRFGDALVLRQAGGDASSLAYKAWKQSGSSADMREETAEQFVSALLQGAMNGATASKPAAPSVSIADFRRVADTVVWLETRCDSLESRLREVAHAAAQAANKKADWNKVRKPAVDWLARY